MHGRVNFNRGQTMGEYAVTFAVVAATIIAMSVFIVRVFQARIFDARRYMINTVKNSAPHVGNVALEYEPYYSEASSTADRSGDEVQGLSGGGGSGRYYRTSQDTTAVKTNSEQLAPKYSGGLGVAVGVDR